MNSIMSFRNIQTSYTAQKMKFSIKDFIKFSPNFVNVTKFAGSCGFGDIC